MKGTIVSLQFGSYLVFAESQFFVCHLPKSNKAILKPVVGDIVSIDDQGTSIQLIYPRTTFIKRPRLANLSELIIVSSLVEPDFSFYLLALFISFARFYNLAIKIIITKTDQKDPKQFQHYWDYLNRASFPLYFFSTIHKNKDSLIEFLQPTKHIIAFAGQTGVGKSTLMNTINPEFDRNIGTYSKALGRGRHETKEVILLPFLDGLIADTPGFSSLELPFTQSDLAKVYPGFENHFAQCKFFNCTHVSEPDCAIMKAVNHAKIPLDIYQDYLKSMAKLPLRKEYH